MLYNVSHNTPEIFAKIDKAVGRPFGFLERFRNGGIGSPKLFINAASSEIEALFALDSYLNSCNIELRPNGIILRFRSKLETYALPIPYYRLTLYKGTSKEYSIYNEQHFVKIPVDKSTVDKFFLRIQEEKVKHLSESGYFVNP